MGRDDFGQFDGRDLSPADRPQRKRPLTPEERKVLARARDPVWFIEKILGRPLWGKQREIARSVATHRRTSVRSGHGTGKTYIAAGIVIWFLSVFPRSRVVTTATKWSQVELLLWHEISQQHRGALFPIGGTSLQTKLELPDGRYAVGANARPGNEEAFSGHHAENLLFVVDEASGVREKIYEAGEGYMTTAGARMLLIGNPTQPAGTFYRSHHSERSNYNAIHIDCETDLPWATGEEVPERTLAALTSREWVEERKKIWGGHGAPLYEVRVRGNFARDTDDTVIGLVLVEQSQARELQPDTDDEKVLSCDVARFGSDETVIAFRHGGRCEIVDVYQGRDTVHTSGRLAQEWKKRGKPKVVVDDVGVGGGVTDQLRNNGIDVIPFDAGGSAISPDDYPNARSESWFYLQQRLEEDAQLPDDDLLSADLVAPKYKLDPAGRRVVEPKEETKKRLGRSPDRGDAIVMLFATRSSGPLVEIW